MTTYKEDDRVILEANTEEGWDEEHGTVIFVEDQNNFPGIYLVEIDDPSDDDDDGIREVHESNMRRE